MSIRTEITVKLEGDSAQYYVLKIFKKGEMYPTVHTSKALSYLRRIENDHKKGYR